MVFCGVLYPVLGGRVLKDISVFTRIDQKVACMAYFLLTKLCLLICDVPLPIPKDSMTVHTRSQDEKIGWTIIRLLLGCFAS